MSDSERSRRDEGVRSSHSGVSMMGLRRSSPVSRSLLKLRVPSGTDCFQGRVVEVLGIALEFAERGYIAVQVVQPNRVRLNFGMRVAEQNPDPVDMFPSQFVR